MLPNIAYIILATIMIIGDNNPTTESFVNGDKWVAEYKSLGGIASYKSDDDGSIRIQKRTNQKPLIGISAIRTQPNIREVELQGGEIDDDDIITVAKWKKVRAVYIIDGKSVTDKGILAMASSPTLSKISICGASITDLGIEAFSGNKTLSYLNVENYAEGNKIINLTLREMPALENLLIGCSGLKCIKISKLPKLKSLEEIPSTVSTIELSDLASVDELNFSRTQLDRLTVLV
jgi:hypothetical protein